MPPLPSQRAEFQHCSTLIYEAYYRFGMEVNADKTKTITGQEIPEIIFKIDGLPLQFVNDIEYLVSTLS